MTEATRPLRSSSAGVRAPVAQTTATPPHASRANALRDAMLRSFAEVLTVMEPLHFMDMHGRDTQGAPFEWRCSPFLGANPASQRRAGSKSCGSPIDAGAFGVGTTPPPRPQFRRNNLARRRVLVLMAKAAKIKAPPDLDTLPEL